MTSGRGLEAEVEVEAVVSLYVLPGRIESKWVSSVCVCGCMREEGGREKRLGIAVVILVGNRYLPTYLPRYSNHLTVGGGVGNSKLLSHPLGSRLPPNQGSDKLELLGRS